MRVRRIPRLRKNVQALAGTAQGRKHTGKSEAKVILQANANGACRLNHWETHGYMLIASRLSHLERQGMAVEIDRPNLAAPAQRRRQFPHTISQTGAPGFKSNPPRPPLLTHGDKHPSHAP